MPETMTMPTRTLTLIFWSMTLGALGLVLGPWLSGNWLSLATVNLGSALIWASIFLLVTVHPTPHTQHETRKQP